MLFEGFSKDVISLNFSSFNKTCVRSRLKDCAYSSFEHVSKISDKTLPDEWINALKNLIENKDLVIQKTDKHNTVLILNKIDFIFRFDRMLDKTSKFTKVHVEGVKALNKIIHVE